MFSSKIWWEIAIGTHFRCQGRCMQWAGHTRRRRSWFRGWGWLL